MTSQPAEKIGPSVIRTVVPLIVGLVLAQAIRLGLDLPATEIGLIVEAVVTAVYYSLVRLAEARLSPVWGWLLGRKGAPVYTGKTSA